MDGLSSDKKRIAAEKLYDLVIAPAYEKLCPVLAMSSKFGERKVRRLAAEDKINLEMILTWVDEQGHIQQKTLRELIWAHNEQCDEAFKYDEEFINNAREPSIREFIKRGWGITEDDELMWVLIMKGIDLFQATIMLNLKKWDITSEAKVLHVEDKKLRVAAAPAAVSGGQQQQQQAPPFAPPQFQQPVPPPYVPPVPPQDSHAHTNPHFNPYQQQQEEEHSEMTPVHTDSSDKNDKGIEEAVIISETSESDLRESEERHGQ